MMLEKVKYKPIVFSVINAYLLSSLIMLVTKYNFEYLLHLDDNLPFIHFILLWIGCLFIISILNRRINTLRGLNIQFLVLLNMYLWLLANLSRSPLFVIGCSLIAISCLYIYHVYHPLNSHFFLLIILIYLLIYLKLSRTSYSDTQLAKFALNPSIMEVQLLIGICLVITTVLVGTIAFHYGYKLKLNIRFTGWTFLSILGIHIVILIGFMYVRVNTFRTPTFDMGIFTQMFHAMIRGQGPFSTLERDRWLSHFAIHLSPIHYLLYPIFYLFPSGLTLEIGQFIICLSGLLPLYLILKHYHFSPWHRWAFMVAYMWLPTLNSGYFYDYHENCFLAPLILWVYYLILTDHSWWGGLASLALLLVKEDAAIYLLSLGVFFLIEKESKITRIKIFCWQIIMPLLYFVVALNWLNHYGQGAMTSRFSNFMLANQSGLWNAVVNALSQPAYTLASMMTPPKIIYLLIIFASQAGLPLLQKKWHPFILLTPLIVINLLSDWIYQVDVFKQYHFGTSTQVFLMTIYAFKAIRRKWQPIFLRLILTISLTATCVFFYQKIGWFTDYFENKANYQQTAEILSKLEKNQPLLASSRYTTALASANQLYDLFYHHQGEVDETIQYLIIDEFTLTGNAQTQEKETIQKYQEAGYEVYIQTEGGLIILVKPEAENKKSFN